MNARNEIGRSRLTVVGGQIPSVHETPFKVETVETLLAQPDPTWLIDGILQEGTLALVYGPPGCGKSFLVQDLAFHLGLGRPWFGRSYDPDQPTGTLYIAAEAGGGTSTRVKAFCRHHGLAGDQIAPESCQVNFVRAAVDLLDPGTAPAIELTWAAWANRFKVFVFDTLSRCMPGGNENSPEHMTAAINTLDEIRKSTGATIIVVHHTPLAEKDRPRGHSSLLAAADTAIMVEKLGEFRQATVAYQRDGREGSHLCFRLKQVETGIDQHGRTVTSCVIEATDSGAARPARPMTDNQQDAYDALVEVVNRAGERAEAEDDGDGDSVTSRDPHGMPRRVTVEAWREEYYRRVSERRDVDRDSYRQSFYRGRNALQKLGKVSFHDGYAWIIWDDRDGHDTP
jgi:hypothetical protein